MELFFLWIGLSVGVGFMSSEKTIGFAGGFFSSLLLSPLIGFVIALLSNPKQEPQLPPLPTGIADEIAKFKKLMDDGLISQYDYEQQRDKLLGK